MIPILYTETETGFASNGIGFLSDVIKVRVLEKLNGIFELELTYPLSGLHAEFLADRYIILAKPDPVSDPQPFRIYRINPASKGTMKVYAQHISYDLMGIPVEPFSAYSAADAMNGLGVHAAVACPFDFVTDKNTAATMTVATPKSIWKLLGGSQGSILDTYGGEYQFDGHTVSLLSRRGQDRGVTIRYGKNLSTLEQDRNCAGVYTGVYPYWASQDGTLVQLPEKVLYASGTYSFIRILDLDLSDRFENVPTEEQLRAKAEQYMADNDIGVPTVSWKVSFVQLEQTEEYKGTAILEEVRMGDSVTVIFPAMNVNATARAVETDFDPVLERYNSVTLGKVRSNLADTILKQQEELDKKPGRTEISGIVSDKLGTVFGARGGAVRLLDTDGDGQWDELYIADNADPNLAVKVWRFNYNGWAASNTGYNGTFTMGATLEDGLLADFITAAHLIAGTIQSQDGESFFLDLDNGIVKANGSFTTTSEDSTMSTIVEAGAVTFTKNGTKIAEMSTKNDISGVPVLNIDMALNGTVFSSEGNRYFVINNGLNPNGWVTRTVAHNLTVEENLSLNTGVYFETSDGAGDYGAILGGDVEGVPGVQIYGRVWTNRSTYVNKTLYCEDLVCYENKDRAVSTENYGTVGMNAMESAGAVFSDMGSAVLDEYGEVYVFHDPKFLETVDGNHDYLVFVSSGSVTKDKEYFTIKGDPGESVDWIVLFKQRGYAQTRMEALPDKLNITETPVDENVEIMAKEAANRYEGTFLQYEDTCEAQAVNYLENYEKEIYGYDY